MMTKSKSAKTEVQVPDNMTPEEVDAFLAGISDEKTRQILAARLKQDAVGNSSAGDAGTAGGGDDATEHKFHV